MMAEKQGLIVKAKYGVFTVISDDVTYECKKRGSLSKDKKNLLVGDIVNFDDEDLMIFDVKERHSHLIRPNIANVDQMIIIFSLIEPEFSYYLALKYVTYANKYHIPSILILTKEDKNVSKEKISEIVETFNKLSIPVYSVSNKTGEGLDKVKPLFKEKTTCLIGQSGVGKSSLLNALDPSFKRSEGSYSEALGRGRHETKEVVLLKYQDGFIADTPGFSSLDLDLYKEDLAKYFPGFEERSNDCYFTDCLHISEKNCQVKKDLMEGKIPQIAYDTYLKLSNDAISYIRRFQK